MFTFVMFTVIDNALKFIIVVMCIFKGQRHPAHVFGHRDGPDLALRQLASEY